VRDDGNLAQFDRPPVVEIVGAAQFVALPRLELRDVVRVSQALDDFDLQELQPELPPMNEAPPGGPDPQQMVFAFGQPPPRALFVRRDGRFVAQLQRDRLAINERRLAPDDPDPSSTHVWPELDRLTAQVAETLVQEEGYGPRHPTFVELTYVNVVHPAPGVWATHEDMHRVVQVVREAAGEEPFAHAERVSTRLSFPLFDAGNAFGGRLHVAAEPAYTAEGAPIVQLNLFSRRMVGQKEDLASVFDRCHTDVVGAFVAITTPEMHAAWQRTK